MVKLTATFFTWAGEHMCVSNLTGKQLKDLKDSAVSDDLLQCDYTFDFDHFDVLATVCSKFNLLVKESLLIKSDNPVLNRTTKSFSLELFDWFYYHCFLVWYQIFLLLYPSDWFCNYCISESMCAGNHDLFFNCQRLKVARKIFNIWSFNKVINVPLNQSGEIHKVFNTEDVAALLKVDDLDSFQMNL